MQIKEIISTTHYWLFKKVAVDSDYYYIRCMNTAIGKYMWFMGYENRHGLVSPVGGELAESDIDTLEKEFQAADKIVMTIQK